MQFTARCIPGAGRGKSLNVPTINVELESVPSDLAEGIYACLVSLEDTTYPGAMHYGPRPVFDDGLSLEVHLIDASIPELPTEVRITVRDRIRDVQNFASAEKLQAQMMADIEQIRATLGISDAEDF